MNPHDRRGLGADRSLVVGNPGAVRRAHLQQARARLHEDLRYPERVADLDELPARDDDLAPGSQRGKGEEDRGRVVVHGQRALGA